MKEARARNTFNEAKKSTEGRDRIFRNMLARYGYTDFFTRGFSLKSLDKQLVHLGKQEKSELIDLVIEALEKDLRKFSTKEREKYKKKIKEEVGMLEESDYNLSEAEEQEAKTRDDKKQMSPERQRLFERARLN